MSSKKRTRSKSQSPSNSDRSRSRSRSRSGRSEDEEEDGARLHVGDLGMGITKRELTRLFDKYGMILDVWVAKSPPCFAFVVFRDKDDAEDALKATDGMTLCGSRIRVTFARPRTRGRGRRGFDPNMRCYQCGERGHFSRDCPDSKYGYKRPPASYHGEEDYGERRRYSDAEPRSPGRRSSNRHSGHGSSSRHRSSRH